MQIARQMEHEDMQLAAKLQREEMELREMESALQMIYDREAEERRLQLEAQIQEEERELERMTEEMNLLSLKSSRDLTTGSSPLQPSPPAVSISAKSDARRLVHRTEAWTTWRPCP